MNPVLKYALIGFALVVYWTIALVFYAAGCALAESEMQKPNFWTCALWPLYFLRIALAGFLDGVD